MIQQIEPIRVLHLFPRIEARLIELLRSLSEEDWRRPTICPGWTVKDIAAHLLDTNIRRLSMLRDGYFGEKPEGTETYEGLVKFLDRLNADWVAAARRISPRVLIEWMETTSREVCEFYVRLDPFAKALFPVSWAGETETQNWFELAREYTERWHHLAQIRLAVNKPGSAEISAIMTRELYYPVLDTFMHAFPRTYAAVEAPEGTTVKVVVTGEAGGKWFLVRRAGSWQLIKTEPASAAAEVSIPQDLAWRLFTNSFPAEARREIQTHGGAHLTSPLFDAVAVMADRRLPPERHAKPYFSQDL